MKFKNKYLGIVGLIFLTSSAMAFTGTYLSLFLKKSLSLSNEQIGIYYSLSSIANVVLSMLLAYFSDKSEKIRKNTIYLGLLSACIGYGIYAISHSYWVIMMISLTLIAISSCITPQLFALASISLDELNISKELKASRMTLIRSVISFSYVVGPLIGTLILQNHNYSRLFLCSSCVYLFGLVFIIVFYRHNNTRHDQVVKQVSKNHVNYQLVVSMFFMFVLVQTVHAVISTIFPLFLVEVKGCSNEIIAFISSSSALVEIPLLMLWTFMVKRMNLKTILILGITSGIFFLLIIYYNNQHFVLFASYLFKTIFYTITIGLGLPFFQSLIQNSQGMATTLFINTSSIGKIISGLILSRLGDNYSLIFLVSTLMIIISIVMLFGININDNQ